MTSAQTESQTPPRPAEAPSLLRSHTTTRVGATMSLDFVKDTVDYPDYQIIK